MVAQAAVLHDNTTHERVASLDGLTFDKADVLATLVANRDEHRGIFLEALRGYEARVTEELQRRLDDVRNHRPVELIIRLEVPKDHTAEYNTVIDMLQRSKNADVALDMDQYNCYIMDNWSWQGNFLANSASYGSVQAAGKFGR
jgi:hypothetical protein